ncbi:protein NRT1/ PTR FAMILY 8.3-like [Phragmites australis]|uniref:protein NRT1/ PTR FAMILY 8.3-like n=1 Tax=Phragmites australis TaxID=29695 RepID=UPI002D76AAF4|nr:protein NRT1/ PTR FAMILY 8.3-like [Phragmites australis]XP_062216287.1 protein NRT1/ PTR FAMILY 8.3-like [Phragmites australis]
MDEAAEERKLLVRDEDGDEEPLLLPQNSLARTSERIINVKGVKHHTGSWRACTYILVTECFEELAYYGIQFNLVTFLKTVLHENNVTAARNYTNWQGTCYIAPVIGAIIADSYWGRCLTIVASFTVYLVGMATMSISASFPTCAGPDCVQDGSSQSVVFFLGLYTMAIGAGGIKPCVSPFGADQFDDNSPSERQKKDSFFNWFFFAIYIGSFVSGTVVVWVQDHYGWVVGLWIPTVFIALAIASFLLGSNSYRIQKPLGSPIVRVFQVIVAAIRKWNVDLPHDDSLLHELHENVSMVDGHKLQHTPVLRFLDKAAVISLDDELSDPWRQCTVTQVEELKAIIGMVPIWATGIVFFAVLAQFSSTFLEQGRTMNKQVGSFAIPAASLASFDAVSVIVWVPVYDRVLVPVARRLTGNERGLSELQRYGTGLLLSVLVMVAAALVETWRLALVAGAHGGEAPMSILWQVPQYFLVGASVVFACVGRTQFFYNEAPASMRSLCSALALLTVALGSYLSSLVVAAVSWLTTRGGEPGWIPDDLNDGHLDRFFWLLAALSALNLAVFVCCARRYKRRNASRVSTA